MLPTPATGRQKLPAPRCRDVAEIADADGSGVDRQRDLKARPAEWRRSDRDAAVVKDDDFLDESQAESGAIPLGREERPEHLIAHRWLDAGTVVFDDDPHHLLSGVDFRLDDHDR